MFNSGNFPSLSDIAAVTNGGNNNDGWGGNNGWWILVILFVLFGYGGWGNGGWGGNGSGGANGAGFQGWATRADVNEGFALNNLQSGINAIQQGICDATYALNNTMTNGFHNQTIATLQGFNGVTAGQNAIQHQISDCCCQTQRAIDGVNYNMATNTCAIQNTIQNTTRDIIDNQNANNRALMDFLVNDKISTLTAENQSLKFAASQQAQNAFITANQEAQTAELIRRIAPPPVPAFVVPAPFGYGCAASCGGCGC